MEVKTLRRSAILALLSLVVAAVVLGSATYAWFTFTTTTDVRDFRGSVARGGADLSIATDPNGPFGLSCELPQSRVEVLEPLSTADLTAFYSGTLQDADGVTVLYREAGEPEGSAIHGRLYLRVDNAPCSVYFWPDSLDLGSDPQLLAALRLGLRVTDPRESRTFIFALDALGDTSGAARRQTTQQSGTVVSAVDGQGRATLVPDPALPLTPYFATTQGEDLLPGEAALCSLEPGEVATVEYWLWLEGCDDACFDPVQSRDIVLALGFAGV